MEQSESSNPSGAPRALALVVLAHVSTAFCAYSIGPLAPFFQSDLQISKAEVGFIISLFYVGVVAGSIPSGYLADRVKAKMVMALGNVVLGSFIFLVGVFPSYQTVLLLMTVAGLGYSTANPVTTKVVMAWFQARRRGTAMSIKQMGVTLGGVLSAAALPAIASAFGWQFALQVTGAFTIVNGILIGFLYKEAPGEQMMAQASRSGSFWSVLFDRQIVLIGVVSGIYSMGQTSVAGYLVLYLHDVHLLPAVVAGFSLAVAQASGTVGRIAWGYASDVVFHRRRRKALIVIGTMTATLSVVSAFMPLGIPMWVLILVSAMFGASALSWNGVLMTLVGESSGKNSVGRSSGVASSFTFLGNVIWAPIFGYIVDVTGSFSYAWNATALVLIVAVGLLVFVVREATSLKRMAPLTG